MAEYVTKEQVIDWFSPYGHFDKPITFETLVSDLRGMTAADVEPVKHGRWDGDTCSACKLRWDYCMVQNAQDWGYFDPMPDYCPNCGARMDEDVNT